MSSEASDNLNFGEKPHIPDIVAYIINNFGLTYCYHFLVFGI